MAWQFVKQPNGNFARWSDMVDGFTHQNMTEAEALEVGRELVGRVTAGNKVNSAKADILETGKSGGGLGRWRRCLAIMEHINPGKARTAREIGEQ